MASASDMPLKEKIGQMLMIGFQGDELHSDNPVVHAILNRQIGGVILFDYNFETKTYDHNIKNPTQLAKLTAQLQDYNKQATQGAYPLLIGLDYEGGKVNRLKEKYGFPKTLSAAEIAKLSLSEATQYANQMAETLVQAGINLNFAPVVDLNINPENPVIGKIERSFSADPNVVADYAAVFSKSYSNHGILCTYKHFPGHGSSTNDTHEGFVDVTKTWQVTELEPYKSLFLNPDSCPVVMTAHIVHYGLDSQGYPATLSKAIIQDLLRDKLNFQGVVITDDLQMKAIADNYSIEQAIKLAINAGADILMFGHQLTRGAHSAEDLVEIIYKDVQSGDIPESRIDEAYQHVMMLKQKLQAHATQKETVT